MDKKILLRVGKEKKIVIFGTRVRLIKNKTMILFTYVYVGRLYIIILYKII